MALVKGRPVYLALSGETMEFDGNAKCVAGLARAPGSRTASADLVVLSLGRDLVVQPAPEQTRAWP